MRYKHILTPIQISGKTLKSRIIHAKCFPMPEARDIDFDRAKEFYVSIARNGAATVNISAGGYPDENGRYSPMSAIHMDDPHMQTKLRELTDAIHAEGTLAGSSLMFTEPKNYNFSAFPPDAVLPLNGDYNNVNMNRPVISTEGLQNLVQSFISNCVGLKELGFDMATFYMSYRASLLANSISPMYNYRTDQYGGATMAERARLSLEIFRGVKAACGQDFLIEVQISPFEESPGYSFDEFLEYAKLCEGLVDIFQIRGYDGSTTHVNGYCSDRDNPTNLKYAEAFKKHNINVLVSPGGGFINLDTAEKALYQGKADLISMARGLWVDQNLGAILQEGRGEDLTPCILCMRCLKPSCSVNPYQGTAGKNNSIFSPAAPGKRVAIVGGGPAGLRAAIDAADRGIQVTLYEKSGELGGQLKFAKYPSFKWPLDDYRKWLIRKVEKIGIELHLNEEATPEMIRAGAFDAVICALGSKPKLPPIQGADHPGVWCIDDVYGQEDRLGKRVVVVGGGRAGRETALYLANCGHTVTLLTRGQEVYAENSHCVYAVVQAYKNEKNLQVIEHAKTIAIAPDSVTVDITSNIENPELDYSAILALNRQDLTVQNKIPGMIYPEFTVPEKFVMNIPEGGNPNGYRLVMPEVPEIERRTILCDSVVVSGGRESCTEEAAAFAGTAEKVYVIGDNMVPASIMECTLTGFAAAMDI